MLGSLPPFKAPDRMKFKSGGKGERAEALRRRGYGLRVDAGRYRIIRGRAEVGQLVNFHAKSLWGILFGRRFVMEITDAGRRMDEACWRRNPSPKDCKGFGRLGVSGEREDIDRTKSVASNG